MHNLYSLIIKPCIYRCLHLVIGESLPTSFSPAFAYREIS